VHVLGLVTVLRHRADGRATAAAYGRGATALKGRRTGFAFVGLDDARKNQAKGGHTGFERADLPMETSHTKKIS